MLIELSELESSLASLALVIGFALVLPLYVRPNLTWHRTILGAVSIWLAVRYMIWRATDTIAPFGLTIDCIASWSFLAIEAGAMLATISAIVMSTRTKARSQEANDHADWFLQEEQRPKVAILIATYNEEKEVLERTIIGAQFLRYPNKEVYVLDDGQRQWLRDFCYERQIGYITRPSNLGAKAGNMNHALDWLDKNERQPDFVAVLDADFVPHRGFLSRSLALFHDKSVGLVQTPQHFFNPDPIQQNLGLTRSYPDEQRYFFDYVQASRDAWGIAFCCGTSSVARWQALRGVGGFPTASITEDFMLTLVLRNAGWNTVYLNEAVTEGLAPEGLKEYVSQRARWCIGMMQIARSHVGPFAKNNLRLRDRWSVLDSCLYWLTTFSFRIAALVYPLLYWFFNITVVDASVPDVLRFFGTYYLWSFLVAQMLSRGMLIPFVQDVTQAVGAIPITRAAVSGLMKPTGHRFVVTAKGGDRTRIVYQWRFMLPFIILAALTFLGLIVGIVFDPFAFNDAGEGKRVILFWTFYNLAVLILAIIACVELPRHETHVMDDPERSLFTSEEGEIRSVWLSRLTANVAFLRGDRFEIGIRGTLQIPDVGPVHAYAIASKNSVTRFQLVPSDTQREAIILKLHAEDNIPGISQGSAARVFTDLADRMLKVVFK